VGGILGGIFGALAFIALIIVGYIFVLPRIRQLRFE
jgi:tetrahydromethanopterin S-methyltransferase subunit D